MATAKQSRSRKQPSKQRTAVEKTSSTSPAPAASTVKKKAKARNQPTRIDWAEAETWYLADTKRSYTDVAKHFNVSKKTVERHASTSDPTWAARRQEVGENAVEQFISEKQRELEETNEKHLKQIRSLGAINTNLVFDLNNLREAVNKLPMDDRVKHAQKLSQAASNVTNALRSMIESERVILGLPIVIAKSENLVEDVTPPSDAEIASENERWAKRQERIDAARRAKTTDGKRKG